MAIFANAAGSSAVAPSGAVSDGVRKSLCSRVPEVRLVPSETTVTTSVARRGAVSARLTRTGLTVGHETGAAVEDCDGVTPGVGVPEALRPEPLEPGVGEAVSGVPEPPAEGESLAVGVLDSTVSLLDGAMAGVLPPATAGAGGQGKEDGQGDRTDASSRREHG